MLIRVARRWPAFTALLVVAACGIPGFDGTVRSATHPEIEIRCDGGQPIPNDVCVVWAEQELAQLPDMGTAKVTALRFTFRGGPDGDRCGVTYDIDGQEAIAKYGQPCPQDPVGGLP